MHPFLFYFTWSSLVPEKHHNYTCYAGGGDYIVMLVSNSLVQDNLTNCDEQCLIKIILLVGGVDDIFSIKTKNAK